MNLNRNDSYHEIYIADKIYRYNGKSLVKYAEGDYISWANGAVRSTPGDGSLYFTGCIHDSTGSTLENVFGEIYPEAILQMRINNGKIQINTEKTHKIVSENTTWLRKSIYVTEGAGSGSGFIISQWRDVTLTAYRYGSTYSYIQVKEYYTGRTGWYKVSSSQVKPLGGWE